MSFWVIYFLFRCTVEWNVTWNDGVALRQRSRDSEWDTASASACNFYLPPSPMLTYDLWWRSAFPKEHGRHCRGYRSESWSPNIAILWSSLPDEACRYNNLSYYDSPLRPYNHVHTISISRHSILNRVSGEILSYLIACLFTWARILGEATLWYWSVFQPVLVG